MFQPPTPTPNKPWSVAIFERERPHLVNWIKTELVPNVVSTSIRNIVVEADVKSGKREMVEFIAMLDNTATRRTEPTRVHVYISSFIRKADKEQRKELSDHNIKVCPIQRDTHVRECIEWIDRHLDMEQHIITHIDEGDYGSGQNQNLNKIWDHIKDNQNITNIVWSATIAEILYSDTIQSDDNPPDAIQEIANTGVHIRYRPEQYNLQTQQPVGFCGPNVFLDSGLVENAMPFFIVKSTSPLEYTLSNQARSLMSELVENMRSNPDKNILFLRLSYSIKNGCRRKESKAIHVLLNNLNHFPELRDWFILVDKDENFEINDHRIMKEPVGWSSRLYWNMKTRDRPIIVIADQTSSRSTEWACHNRVYALHDFRHTQTYSAYAQALQRPNHYASKYPTGFQKIRIFGNKKVFELAAGRIRYSDYLHDDWVIRKVDHRIVQAAGGGNDARYEIRNVTTRDLHECCVVPDGAPRGILTEDADDMMLRLGCGHTMSLSQRVMGDIKRVANIVTRFYPCHDADSYNEVIQTPEWIQFTAHNFRNPFNHPILNQNGEHLGHMRGYHLLDYESNVVGEKWGFNDTNRTPRLAICYNNGILGVGVRILNPDEEFVIAGDIRTINSMYV